MASMHPNRRSPIPLPDRILVVRLSAMGDIIHGMPAIAALRHAKPELKIGWLIEERWAELLCSRESERLAPRSQLKPLADWVHVANFSRWRHALLSGETWRDIRSCLRGSPRDELRAGAGSAGCDSLGACRARYRRESPSWIFATTRSARQRCFIRGH